MIARLKSLLKQHEGIRLKPYMDTASPPRITIGIGHNLSDNGISVAIAEAIFDEDISNALSSIQAIFYTFATWNEARQIAMTDMMFNLGKTTFEQFHGMIACIWNDDWAGAADHMLQSLWARQVGYRAIELADMVREG